jgi:hypothetical protein
MRPYAALKAQQHKKKKEFGTRLLRRLHSSRQQIGYLHACAASVSVLLYQ